MSIALLEAFLDRKLILNSQSAGSRRARRPIFALTDPGATATIIRDGRLGWVVDAEDTAGCKKLLAEVLARPVPEALTPDETYLQQFDRRRLTGRLAELFDAVVADAHGASPGRG